MSMSSLPFFFKLNEGPFDGETLATARISVNDEARKRKMLAVLPLRCKGKGLSLMSLPKEARTAMQAKPEVTDQ